MYGSFLLAIYDEEREEFQTISKIGTGFSEEKLVEVTAQLNEHLIDQPRRYYRFAPENYSLFQVCVQVVSSLCAVLIRAHS